MFCFFFFNDTATTEIYTLSLHDALPIRCRSSTADGVRQGADSAERDLPGITGFDRGEGPGRPGEHDVARTEREIAGEINQLLGDVPGQLTGVGLGNDVSVHRD